MAGAFGNYRDLLDEVSTSPLMGKYLTFDGNRRLEGGRYPDENFARELMQLFTIGLHELHANGTKRLDPATAAPIDTYSNVDIVAFARVWTGWGKRGMRRNIEGGSKSQNYIDPMQLHADRRDPFPKTKLQGGYLGDGYPLCAELPARAFLLRGAKYEKIGGHSNLVGREKFDDDLAGGGTTTDETVRPHFAPSRGSSQLYAALCAAADGDSSGGRCAFPAAVVLGAPLACDGPVECGADTLRNVKMVDGTGRVCFYAYVPPPCTRLAFFEQGNGRYVEQGGNRQCADASVAGSAGVSCCHDLTPVYRLSPRAALMGKDSWTGAKKAGWLCMDGDVRTYCMSGRAGTNTWLRFDMGRRVRFSRVKIFNQYTLSGNRFQTFVLELSDSGSSSGSWTACHTGNARAAIFVEARCEGVGRYLRVRSTYRKWLHLNEVQIFGGAAPGEEMPPSSGAGRGTPLVFRGYTPTPNLAACEGDCDNDGHCAAGLKCFQRDGSEDIPGCAVGGFGDKPGADYCYDPASQPPPLASHGSTPSSYNLSACEGDCDNDGHCAEGLKCFQRDGTAPVPGCSAGGAGDVKDHDFCFAPEQPKPPPPNNGSVPLCASGCLVDAHCAAGLRCLQLRVKNLVSFGSNGKANMLACEGDCDSDSDCAGGFNCFQRSSKREAVPGCAENPDVPASYDFCYASSTVPGCPAAEAGNIPDGGYCYDPNHAAAVVRELATLLTAGRLHGGSRALIEAEYARVAAARGDAAAVKHAMKLFVVTPEIRVTNLAPPTAKARTPPVPLASQGRGYKAVIVINMVGGADSFQMLQPHSGCEIRSQPGPNVSHDLHAELLAVRGADKMQGKDGLLPIAVAPGTQPCDTFGVHPRMKHVRSLYGAGDALWIANMGR